jgi:lichenan operon transcriptional antiterminator
MSNPSTGQALADQLDVSLRSIRSYVKEINETIPDTITSSKDGYEINSKKALDILALSEDFIPQTSSERSNFIITKLLMSNRRSSINIYDLSEEMYVSVSTLKNDLRTVKSTVSKFDLELGTMSRKRTI